MFNSGGNTFGGFGQSNNANSSNATPSQSNQTTFGGFGTTANNTTQVFGQSPQGTTGSNAFGAFGGNTATSQQTNSPAFGSFRQPTQQRNSFGFGTTNSSSTPSFGSGATGLFGTPSASNAAPVFGAQSSTGLFNPTNANNAFGSSVFSPSNVSNSTNTTGTSNPPFSVQVEKEGAGGAGTNHFQSITCMPAYSGSSFEELRVQDYNQNRRYASTSAAFNSGGFGSGSSNAAGAFGSSNTNGIFASQTQPSPFGMSSSSTMPAFGQNSSTKPGAFGSNPGATNSAFNAPATGLFGSNSTQNTTTTFGGPTNANAMFGNSNPVASTPFGQATTAPFGGTPNSSSPFGNSNTANPFGPTSNVAAKPFSFGSAQGNNSFGQPSNPANQANTNVFGSTTSGTASMPSTSSFFGQSAAPVNTSSGLFGQSHGVQSTNPGFSFGGNSIATGTNTSGTNGNAISSGFSFGGTGTGSTVTPSTTKPFSFGTSAPTTAGGFNVNSNNAMSKPFSFGASSSAAQPGVTTSPFGQAPSTSVSGNSGMMFGSTQSNGLFNTDVNSSNQASASTANFFPKSATTTGGGLFASNTQAQAGQSLFGNSMSQNQPVSGNFSLGTSGFGSGLNSINGTNQLQFGQSVQQPVNNNPYGSNPLFSSVSNYQNGAQSLGPIATPLVSSAAKKKPANLPHFRLSSQSPAPSPRLFSAKKSNLFSNSLEESNRKSQFTIFDEDLLLFPDAFSPRTNIKRLVIDRKTSQDNFLSGELDLEVKETGPPKVGETTRLPRNARNTEAAEQASAAKDTGVNSDTNTQGAPDGDRALCGGSEISPDEVVKVSEDTAHAKTGSDHSYWTSPPLSVLLDYSKSQLSKVKDFKVGRRGYGQISFLSPVDLSTFEIIEDVASKVIVFDHKMCTVYPEENLKPAIGKGLNVAATITLEHCYPLSKDKREPIRNSEHPRSLQHVDRLKRMVGTTFVDYLADSGTWIFTVEHF